MTEKVSSVNSKQSVREEITSFEVTMNLPKYNKETEEAMYEANAIIEGKIKVKSYSCVRDLFEELDKEM